MTPGPTQKRGGLFGWSWREVAGLVQRVAPERWSAPLLIVLGLAVALADTAGVGLVILFLYAATDQVAALAQADGGLGRALAFWPTPLGQAGAVAGLLFFLIVLRAALSAAYGLIVARRHSRIGEAVQNALHRQYLKMSYSDYRSREQSELLDIIASQSWAIGEGYLGAVRLVINIGAIAVFVAVLLTLSWPITAIAAAGSVAVFMALSRMNAPARALGEHTRDMHQSLAERMLVTLQGMRVIRAFGQERAHQESFEDISAETRRTSLALSRVYAAINPVTEISHLGLLFAILATARAMDIPFATVLTAVALLYRLQPHTRELQANLMRMSESGASIRAVLAMLDPSGKRFVDDGRTPFHGLSSAVRFEDVSFHFGSPDRPVLKNVSFTLRAGETTALLGGSGAGKTTVANLLLRLYEPTAGRITVDGEPLSDLRRTDWLSRTAVAGQDVDLIEGTVGDNVRLARPDASAAEVEAALEDAGALSFVNALPERLDAWIGQQGLNLSGGQRQRIGLARALLRDPDLLILDEATSALDLSTEAEIRARLERRFAGKTLLIITHRVSSVLSADHVVCLEDGRVAEAGPPRVLTREKGAFATMLESAAA